MSPVTIEDQRPDPKPRKHPRLWQAYQTWYELVELRKKHTLRISSIEAGKSQFDLQFEKDFLQGMALDMQIEGGTMQFDDGIHPVVRQRIMGYKKIMIAMGEELGPIWQWITSIRGFKEGSMAAQLLAQIDDIGKFDTVSKLWRFAGLAVIDGKAERNTKGEVSHYNRLLKSICWLIASQFVRHQTIIYVDIYYEEKQRIKGLHPNPVCCKCGAQGKEGKSNTKGESFTTWKCPNANSSKEHRIDYTPIHIDLMAKRKMSKIFLQHLWLKWREYEGLSISEPYVQAIMGHTHIIPPPEFDNIDVNEWDDWIDSVDNIYNDDQEE